MAQYGPLTIGAGSFSLRAVPANLTIIEVMRRHGGFWLAALPFFLLLWFCPEPIQPQFDDFLPSSPARLATLKLVRALGPEKGDKSVGAQPAMLMVGGALITVCLGAFILVASSPCSIHFLSAGHRPVRSPPGQRF